MSLALGMGLLAGPGIFLGLRGPEAGGDAADFQGGGFMLGELSGFGCLCEFQVQYFLTSCCRFGLLVGGRSSCNMLQRPPFHY